MRRAARKDANHAAVVSDLRARGYQVEDMSRHGEGVPDLWVSRGPHARWVEVKAIGGGKRRGATQDASLARQQAFRARHPGHVIVATSADAVDAAWPPDHAAAPRGSPPTA